MDYEAAARKYHQSGNNCAMSVSAAYAEKLGITPEEAIKAAPAPRSEGGRCGAFLAGKKILSQLRPEAVPEFEKRFAEINGTTECRALLASRGARKKSCNDYVGDAARLVEELLR